MKQDQIIEKLRVEGLPFKVKNLEDHIRSLELIASDRAEVIGAQNEKLLNANNTNKNLEIKINWLVELKVQLVSKIHVVGSVTNDC